MALKVATVQSMFLSWTETIKYRSAGLVRSMDQKGKIIVNSSSSLAMAQSKKVWSSKYKHTGTGILCVRIKRSSL